MIVARWEPSAAQMRFNLALLGLLSLATSLAGCDKIVSVNTSRDTSKRSSAVVGHHDRNTVIVGRPTDAISLDPAVPTDNESVEVINQIYDRLLNYRTGSNVIVPGLATKWNVSADGRTWTFELRRGVKFHDGTPFNADAVVFSIERQRDKGHEFHRGDFAYWENVYRNLQKVEKLDDFKVRITIEGPYSPFEANMAMFPVSIVSPTAVKRMGKLYEFFPVGTGPFRMPAPESGVPGGPCPNETGADRPRRCTAWLRGERILLERNPDYWGDKAELKRLVFQVIPDPRQRLIALESGSVDVAYAILPEELQFVELHPNLRLYKRPANNVSYLAMNTTRPPFTDVRVRRAANYAINKGPIVKLIYQGRASRADGPLPPGQWGYHAAGADEKYEFDPSKARMLLAEARRDGAFDPNRVFTLYVPTTPRPYLPKPEQLGRFIQANLAEVGIQTRLKTNPFKAHLHAVQHGMHDLCVLGWVGDNGDPDNFLYVLLDQDNTVKGLARNVAFYADDLLHKLLLRAQRTSDRATREQLYVKVQKRVRDKAPWVPIAHSQITIAARDDIGGVIINPSSQIGFKTVRRIPR